MRYDYSKLQGRIKEIFGNLMDFYKAMGWSAKTGGLKLDNKVFWKQPEISRACNILNITSTDIPAYFFKLNVQ